MLFNSLEFLVFLPVIFIVYWGLNKKEVNIQNALLLVASYYFYSCWDWRFLFLLLFSTWLDYAAAIKIQSSDNSNLRKFWFWLSILANIGFLGFFKYYNFFIASFTELLQTVNIQVNPYTLKIILPVGISFYTFHGLSYIIDVYKGRIVPEKNIITYSLFVSYFPLLVAGPIERATHLLPQLKRKRFFNYNLAVDGLRQILWGLFKKIVIADNCAEYVNLIFESPENHSGSTLLIGAVFFSFQIYGDFSGYSDIALGTSKLFGIQLLKNFNYPYFSRDVAEFWRRWHISLSSWFKDYLYIPLGGSKGGAWMKIRNTFIIFIVSGFWHGSNWTFIFWGFLNALFIMPSVLLGTNRNNIDIVAKNTFLPSLKESFQVVSTFFLITFAWIFFRADNLHHAFTYVSHLFSETLFMSFSKRPGVWIITFLLFFVVLEWLGRKNDFAIQKIGFNHSKYLRGAFYVFLVLIILLSVGKEQQFIYFQF